MYTELNGNKWWVNRSQSCFTFRNGKQDVSIYKQSCWGRRQPDGKLYKCCLRLAAEDGSVIRNYETVPSELNVDWLKQAGFIDA